MLENGNGNTISTRMASAEERLNTSGSVIVSEGRYSIDGAAGASRNRITRLRRANKTDRRAKQRHKERNECRVVDEAKSEPP